jgi:hypothetical protein
MVADSGIALVAKPLTVGDLRKKLAMFDADDVVVGDIEKVERVSASYLRLGDGEDASYLVILTPAEYEKMQKLSR